MHLELQKWKWPFCAKGFIKATVKANGRFIKANGRFMLYEPLQGGSSLKRKLPVSVRVRGLRF